MGFGSFSNLVLVVGSAHPTRLLLVPIGVGVGIGIDFDIDFDFDFVVDTRAYPHAFARSQVRRLGGPVPRQP
jgi:hypothetical protein